jgi:archaellum component FlaF (FlaF/FlaG flagellin family)
MGMRRRAFSAFVATLILLSAAIVIGGLIYTYLQGYFVSFTGAKSLKLLNSRVLNGPGSAAVQLTLLNDGARPLTINRISVSDQGGVNMTITSVTPPLPHAVPVGQVSSIVVMTSKNITGSFAVIAISTLEGYSASFPIQVQG